MCSSDVIRYQSGNGGHNRPRLIVGQSVRYLVKPVLRGSFQGSSTRSRLVLSAICSELFCGNMGLPKSHSRWPRVHSRPLAAVVRSTVPSSPLRRCLRSLSASGVEGAATSITSSACGPPAIVVVPSTVFSQAGPRKGPGRSSRPKRSWEYRLAGQIGNRLHVTSAEARESSTQQKYTPVVNALIVADRLHSEINAWFGG